MCRCTYTYVCVCARVPVYIEEEGGGGEREKPGHPSLLAHRIRRRALASERAPGMSASAKARKFMQGQRLAHFYGSLSLSLSLVYMYTYTYVCKRGRVCSFVC